MAAFNGDRHWSISLSLLDDINLLPHSDHIVLVHGVRYERDLVYKYLIEQLQQRYEGRLRYVPIVSRESIPGKLQGRIPELIASGELVNRADLPFSKQSSFVMMCGNPEMIKDTSPVLQGLGTREVSCPNRWQYHLREILVRFD